MSLRFHAWPTAHWEHFVQQSDYVIDWAAQSAPPHIADRLARYSASDDAAIWLERLVAAIAPEPSDTQTRYSRRIRPSH